MSYCQFNVNQMMVKFHQIMVNQAKNKFQLKPPIVVVVGHIDHGKTSILDYIRKTRVAHQEEGGITQHISACQVEWPASIDGRLQKITFIDTPGHELFTAMRLRGTQVASLALLVIAADDGVNTQTIEIIHHIKETKIPFIVVINKIDLEDIEVENIKQQLAQNGVLIEEWGGEVPTVLVSAKTGAGINEMMEIIFLMTEMQNIQTDYSIPAQGIVIESYMDSLRGITTVLLIKEGTMKIGEIIVIDSQIGKIKIMEDWLGHSIKEGLAATPVTVLGLKEVSQPGSSFQVFSTLEKAENYLLKIKSQVNKTQERNQLTVLNQETKTLNIILKADTLGSLESIEKFLEQFYQPNITVQVLKKEIGKVNESDVTLASNFEAVIIAFRVQSDPVAQQMINQKEIKIFYFQVVYHLIKDFSKIIEQSLEPKKIKVILGKLKITAIFHQDKKKQIIGGKVIEGDITTNYQVNVLRKIENDGTLIEQVVNSGKIEEIQQINKTVKKVPKNQECAVLFKGGEEKIQKDDILEIYKEELEKIKI